MSKFFLAVVVVALSACAPAAEKKEDVTPAVAPAAAAPADTTAPACDMATKKCEAVAK